MSNFAGCYKPLGYEDLLYKKRGNERKKEGCSQYQSIIKVEKRKRKD
jgi:hypothetical protein